MLDHVALYVRDLESMRRFYEKYFGAKANQKYENVKTGLSTYFLTFPKGGRLELMTRPEVNIDREENRLGLAHLAFGLGSDEAVDALTARMAADGYSILSAPRVTGDGYYESCIADPEGNPIELVG